MIEYRTQCPRTRKVIGVVQTPTSNRQLNQQHGIFQVSRALGEFHVRAVHEMARVITDHACGALARQSRAHFRRRLAQGSKIMMGRQFHDFEFATEAGIAAGVEQLICRRMRDGTGAVQALRFRALIRLPFLRHREHGHERALAIA